MLKSIMEDMEQEKAEKEKKKEITSARNKDLAPISEKATQRAKSKVKAFMRLFKKKK